MTISTFLRAAEVDRLHVVLAPMLIGRRPSSRPPSGYAVRRALRLRSRQRPSKSAAPRCDPEHRRPSSPAEGAPGATGEQLQMPQVARPLSQCLPRPRRDASVRAAGSRCRPSVPAACAFAGSTGRMAACDRSSIQNARASCRVLNTLLSIARRSVGMVLYSQSMRRLCVTRG